MIEYRVKEYTVNMLKYSEESSRFHAWRCLREKEDDRLKNLSDICLRDASVKGKIFAEIKDQLERNSDGSQFIHISSDVWLIRANFSAVHVLVVGLRTNVRDRSRRDATTAIYIELNRPAQYYGTATHNGYNTTSFVNVWPCPPLFSSLNPINSA